MSIAAPVGAVLVWLAAVAACDLGWRRIPNVLSLGGAAAALLVLLSTGTSVLGGSPKVACCAALLAVVITLPAYALGGLGAGDVKLAFAIGLISDTVTSTMVLVVGGVLAGLWTAVWLLWRRPTAAFQGTPEGGQPGSIAAIRGRPVPIGAIMCAAFAASIMSQNLVGRM